MAGLLDCELRRDRHRRLRNLGTAGACPGLARRRSTFFLDSSGVASAVPYKTPRPTNTDEDLAQALSRLMLDAGADVEHPDAAVETNLLVWMQIPASPLPMVINADDVIPH